jgi:HSP20 family protein
MSDLYSGTDLFSELDRLQREKARLFGGFPQLNIGATDDSIEIVAFAPGDNTAELRRVDREGLLTISGARTARER